MPSSQPQATPVNNQAFLNAVAEALEDLRNAKKLIAAQDAELKSTRDLVALERQLSDGLKKINSLSAAEIEQLKIALSAKDRVIAAVEGKNAVLEDKLRKSTWDKFKWGIGGLLIGAVIGVVLANK